MHFLRRTSLHALLVLVWGFLLAPTAPAHPGSGIAVDKHGQVYFLDTGSGLWKIDTRGTLTKLSPTRYHWLALDAENRLAGTRLPSGANGDIEKVGADPTVLLASDWPIAMGPNGTLYHPAISEGSLRINQLLPSGEISIFATLPATTAGSPLLWLNGLTVGADGSLYYTENSSIRRVNDNGVVSTVATVSVHPDGPAIPGMTAELGPLLRGLEVDAQGVMYVASSGDGRMLKITPEGKITTLFQTQSPWSPTGVALFGNDVYVLEYLHSDRDVRTDWLPRVRKIAPDGTSQIIAFIKRDVDATP